MSPFTVHLPDEQRAFVEESIASGRFQSADAFFHSLVLDAQRHAEHERIDELLIEGLDCKEEFVDTPERQILRRKKLAEMIAKRESR